MTGEAAMRPVDAGIPTRGTRAFGNRRSESHTHQGIDMIARSGTPVRAVRGGTVTHAARELAEGFSGYGRHVVVRVGDGGPWLLFAHLEDVNVQPGDTVQQGTVIGTVGNTCFRKPRRKNGKPIETAAAAAAARCKGPHLHFEVSPHRYPQKSEARRLDPVAWLSEGTHNTDQRRAPAALPARISSAIFVPMLIGAFWIFVGRRKA